MMGTEYMGEAGSINQRGTFTTTKTKTPPQPDGLEDWHAYSSDDDAKPFWKRYGWILGAAIGAAVIFGLLKIWPS